MSQTPMHAVTGTNAAGAAVFREVVAVVNLDGSAIASGGAAGGATEATLAAQSAKLPASIGQKTMAASLAVALASDQATVKTAEQAGSGSMRYLSDTTALASVSYSYIQVITNTVFSTLTNANSTGGSITTLTIPAGTVLRGAFTAIALASGAVALYV